MVNPKLRILLVDDEPGRLQNIEKNLSALGYNRVAPLTSFRELLAVVDNALSPFDLLIIHQNILDKAGEVLEQSVRTTCAIKHLLVYQGDAEHVLCAVESRPSAMRFTLPCMPNNESIKHVMGHIDNAKYNEVHIKKSAVT